MFPDSVPALSPLVETRIENGSVLLSTDEIDLTFEDSSATTLAKSLPHFDSRRSVAKIASHGGVDLKELRAILSLLAEESVAIDLNAPLAAETSEDFLEAYFKECQFLTHALFAQPFWQQILAGDASQDLVMGWGIETLHYVRAANEHMAISVAQCRESVRWRYLLAEHYLEEFDHDDIFLQGILDSGFRRRAVNAAPPLASTRALINFFTELASVDTLGYLGVFGVMQAARDETTGERINALYDDLSAKYPFARPMFDAFRKHALIDVELDHQGIVLEDVCQESTLSGAERERVMRAARDTYEHFVLFFEGIHDFYRREGICVPRRRADIHSLISAH